MKATFINTEGEYLQAELEIAGVKIYAMDVFGGDQCKPGEEIEVELAAGLHYEEETWESMFSGNPKGKKKFLEYLYHSIFRILPIHAPIILKGALMAAGNFQRSSSITWAY